MTSLNNTCRFVNPFTPEYQFQSALRGLRHIEPQVIFNFRNDFSLASQGSAVRAVIAAPVGPKLRHAMMHCSGIPQIFQGSANQESTSHAAMSALVALACKDDSNKMKLWNVWPKIRGQTIYY